MKKNRLKIQKAAIQSLLDEKTILMDDLIIYVGGRFGNESEASYMEISTAIKLYKSTIQSYSGGEVSESQ